MNRMKKLLSLLAIATMTAVSFTSCLSDDNNSSNSGSTPTGYISRAYVLNAGSWGTIDGTLSKITGTYTSSSSSSSSSTTSSSPTYTSTTMGTLGDTANDILVYGSKMYVVVTGTNEIVVYNRKTLSLLERINTQSLLGGGAEGCQPRHIAAANNLIYFTTYGVDNNSSYVANSKGYVAAIDTTNFALQTKYEVGPYPEDLVAASIGSSTTNYYVFVTNSDYGQGNGSISTITINNGTGTVATSTFDGIKNPTQIDIAGNYIWIQDMATYGGADTNYAKLTDDAIWAWGGSTTSKPTKTIEASMFATLTLTNYYGSGDARLYFVKDPYGTPSYGYYSVSSGSTTTLDGISGVAQPCAIGADPYTGNIYIASLATKGDYTSSGYVNIYNYTGTLVKSQLGAGVNPTAFAFDFEYIYHSIYTSQY